MAQNISFESWVHLASFIAALVMIVIFVLQYKKLEAYAAAEDALSQLLEP